MFQSLRCQGASSGTGTASPNARGWRFQSLRCQGASSGVKYVSRQADANQAVSIPSMPGRFFRQLCGRTVARTAPAFQSLRCQGASSGHEPPPPPFAPVTKFQSLRCQGASSGRLDLPGEIERALDVSIPSMPGRFFRRRHRQSDRGGAMLTFQSLRCQGASSGLRQSMRDGRD